MAGMPKYGTSAELPSEEELGLIGQVRSSCQREIEALSSKSEDVVGDLRVCRFLRSKEGDVSQATAAFKEFLRWRADSTIEADRLEVVGRSPEDFLVWWARRCNPYFPICPYAGRNPDGHVIYFIRMGMVSAQKFEDHRRHPKEEDMRMLFQMSEWLLWHLDVLSRKEGRMVYAVKLLDFGGLAEAGRPLPIFVPGFKRFMLEFVGWMSAYYCDADSLVLGINTNFMFRTFFAMMKYAIARRQLSKFYLVGHTSERSARETIREFVPEACLPVECGGQKQEAVGAYPVATADEIEEWYWKRCRVQPELVPSCN